MNAQAYNSLVVDLVVSAIKEYRGRETKNSWYRKQKAENFLKAPICKNICDSYNVNHKFIREVVLKKRGQLN